MVFDSWYSGKDNLKAIRGHGWTFLTQVRSNRRVNRDRQGNRPVRALPIAASGTVVHREGFGLVKVFRIVASNGHTEHWITNDLQMDEATRLAYAEQAWGIEEYHRGLQQYCGVERAQVRHADAQRNHIGCALRALVRLEYHRFTTGISWLEAKVRIIREARANASNFRQVLGAGQGFGQKSRVHGRVFALTGDAVLARMAFQ